MDVYTREPVLAEELELRVIYAVPAQEKRPIIAGKARVRTINEVELTFSRQILEQIDSGILRPFVFLADHLER